MDLRVLAGSIRSCGVLGVLGCLKGSMLQSGPERSMNLNGVKGNFNSSYTSKGSIQGLMG